MLELPQSEKQLFAVVPQNISAHFFAKKLEGLATAAGISASTRVDEFTELSQFGAFQSAWVVTNQRACPDSKRCSQRLADKNAAAPRAQDARVLSIPCVMDFNVSHHMRRCPKVHSCGEKAEPAGFAHKRPGIGRKVRSHHQECHHLNRPSGESLH